MSDCSDMLHTDDSFMGIGILNLEWAVLPPSNSSAAIPKDATAKAILPNPLMVDSNASVKKGFPWPLGALKKEKPVDMSIIINSLHDSWKCMCLICI